MSNIVSGEDEKTKVRGKPRICYSRNTLWTCPSCGTGNRIGQEKLDKTMSYYYYDLCMFCKAKVLIELSVDIHLGATLVPGKPFHYEDDQE